MKKSLKLKLIIVLIAIMVIVLIVVINRGVEDKKIVKNIGMPPTIYCESYNEFIELLNNDKVMIVPNLDKYPTNEGMYTVCLKKDLVTNVKYVIRLGTNNNEMEEDNNFKPTMENSAFKYLTIKCVKTNSGYESELPLTRPDSQTYVYKNIDVSEFKVYVRDAVKVNIIDAEDIVDSVKLNSVWEYWYMFNYDGFQYQIAGMCMEQQIMQEEKNEEEMKMKLREEVFSFVDSIIENSKTSSKLK